MRVEPYLNFNGRAEEAFEFYKKAVGAEVTAMMRFKDAPPEAGTTPEAANKVMHAVLRIGDAVLMASDGRCTGATKFEGISLALNAKDEAEAKKFFDALLEGGQVQMPLGKTFFSPAFGMLADRFGVTWMVVVPTS